MFPEYLHGAELYQVKRRMKRDGLEVNPFFRIVPNVENEPKSKQAQKSVGQLSEQGTPVHLSTGNLAHRTNHARQTNMVAGNDRSGDGAVWSYTRLVTGSEGGWREW